MPLGVEIVLFRPWNDLSRRAGFDPRSLNAGALLAIAECIALFAARAEPGGATMVGLAGYLVTVLWRLRWLEPSQRFEWRVWLAFHKHTRPSWLSHPRPLTIALATLVSIGLLANSALGVLLGMTTAVGLAVFTRAPWRLALPGAVWSGIYAGVAVLLLTLTHQLTWVLPDAQVIGGVTSLLVQIQLVLGVLPLSAILVGAQIVAGWLGLRGVHVGARRSVLVSVAALCCSLALDVYTLGSKTADPRWAEVAELAMVVALLIALAAVIDVLGQLSTEKITASLIGRLDAGWLMWIVTTVDPYHMPVWRQDDPFDAVLGLLTRSVLRDGESDVFLNALRELSRRLDEIASVDIRQGSIERRGPPEDVELALDSYMAEEMMPLVEQLASRGHGWPIDEFVRWRWHLEATATEWHDHTGTLIDASAVIRGRPHESPDGIQMYGTVIDACLPRRLDAQAKFAIIRSARYVLRALVKLPDPTGSREVDPNAREHLPERREVPKVDALTGGIEGYLFTTQRWAETASASRAAESLKAIATSLQWLTERGLEADDRRWAEWIVRRVGMTAHSVATTGGKAGLSAYSVPSLDNLTSHREMDEAIVQPLAQWVAASLADTAQVVDWFECRQAAMLATDLFPTFPIEAALIAGALKKVGDTIPARPEGEQANLRWAFEPDLAQLKRNAIRLLVSSLKSHARTLKQQGPRAVRKSRQRLVKRTLPGASAAPDPRGLR